MWLDRIGLKYFERVNYALHPVFFLNIVRTIFCFVSSPHFFSSLLVAFLSSHSSSCSSPFLLSLLSLFFSLPLSLLLLSFSPLTFLILALSSFRLPFYPSSSPLSVLFSTLSFSLRDLAALLLARPCSSPCSPSMHTLLLPGLAGVCFWLMLEIRFLF